MFQNFTYKKKFYLAMGGAILLLWLGFKFGISRTLELKGQLEEQESKLSEIQDAPARLHSIEARLELLNGMIGDVSGDEVSPYLIEKVGTYCEENDLVFSGMPGKHLFEKEDYKVATYSVKVQGSFDDMLPLLHELEHNSSAGKLRSAVFQSEYVLREKRKILEGIFYMQSVMK